MRPTRFYSDKQEKNVAKTLGGKTVTGSGATKFKKGDVELDDWLIECKTAITDRLTFNFKRDWMDKISEQAFAMGKHNYAVCCDFATGERFYVLDEKTMQKCIRAMEGDNDGT